MTFQTKYGFGSSRRNFCQNYYVRFSDVSISSKLVSIVRNFPKYNVIILCFYYFPWKKYYFNSFSANLTCHMKLLFLRRLIFAFRSSVITRNKWKEMITFIYKKYRVKLSFSWEMIIVWNHTCGKYGRVMCRCDLHKYEIMFYW